MMDNTKKIACDIAIVGCGVGGLSAAIALRRQGHDVTIWEQAARMSETGAGIQIPPNSARILNSWGLLEVIEEYSVEPEGLIVRAHQDGTVISNSALVPRMKETYGAPWLLIHRADFYRVLAEEAERLGVKIQLGCAVARIDCSCAPIIVSTSIRAEMQVDVVLGADGIHSKCRGMIHDSSEPQLMTKDFVHRIMITGDAIKAHSELVDLSKDLVTNTWMGPGAHVVGYPLKGNRAYNFVFICDILLNTLSEMRNHFKDWDPRLRLVLEVAHDVQQWPLTASLGKERWVHAEGNFALLGDACHAMLPYLAQGAAQAVEDGAVLGAVFGVIRQKADIRDTLLMYERLRRPRTTRVMELSTKNDKIFHMLERGEGNEKHGQHGSTRPFASSLEIWADPGLRDWLFGYDVVQDAEESARKLRSLA